MRFAALTLLVASTALAKDKLIVLPLQGTPELEALVKAAGEQIATDLQKDGRFEVLGQSELQTLLGLERQRELLGCSDEAGTCVQELSGALDAPYLLTGTMTKTPEGVRIDLKLLQTQKATVLAREGALAATEAELLPTTTQLVADLVLQLPGARASQLKKRLPLYLSAVGGALAVAGLCLLGAEGIQTGNLQGRLTTHTIDGLDANRTRGQIYLERGVAVSLVTVGLLGAVASLLWWWLE